MFFILQIAIFLLVENVSSKEVIHQSPTEIQKQEKIVQIAICPKIKIKPIEFDEFLVKIQKECENVRLAIVDKMTGQNYVASDMNISLGFYFEAFYDNNVSFFYERLITLINESKLYITEDKNILITEYIGEKYKNLTITTNKKDMNDVQRTKQLLINCQQELTTISTQKKQIKQQIEKIKRKNQQLQSQINRLIQQCKDNCQSNTETPTTAKGNNIFW